ncbi:DUF2505 domain-containing protein [Flexivirga oryzae]|uniref:DUF2505 domain-containing protein n=1 Tax=Flexivirga oryzae TaxID=1794944 RepID=A0A839NC82_9MICO|nr:DUF2505 domain-containing protein [Flexivirga oryzae]MBB2893246.1 hypothetical protein [Flexivirga oryzae]
MTRSARTTYTLDISPADLATALAAPEFAVARLAAARREDPVLVSHSTGHGRTRITARYFTRKDELPGWMQGRFPDHGPENVRTEDWVVDGDGLSGKFTVESTSNSTSLRGTYRVSPTATGSEWVVEATASAGIPLLGRKIEAFLLASLDSACAQEAQEMSAAAVRIG